MGSTPRPEAADDPEDWPDHEPDLPKYRAANWRNEKTVHNDPDCFQLANADEVVPIESAEFFERGWYLSFCSGCHDWQVVADGGSDWGPQRALKRAAEQDAKAGGSHGE
jgi:hypothetical protein